MTFIYVVILISWRLQLIKQVTLRLIVTIRDKRVDSFFISRIKPRTTLTIQWQNVFPNLGSRVCRRTHFIFVNWFLTVQNLNAFKLDCIAPMQTKNGTEHSVKICPIVEPHNMVARNYVDATNAIVRLCERQIIHSSSARIVQLRILVQRLGQIWNISFT